MAERFLHNPVKNPPVRYLSYKEAGVGVLETTKLTELRVGEIHLKALYSGISRGTESLVFHGKIPHSEHQRMRCPHQRGDFTFPISYGYQMVATVIKADINVKNVEVGNSVFLLHPHQSEMVVSAEVVSRLPASLPPRRAVLAANMETALNAVWDANLSGGERICVIGAGVVGLLTAYLARKMTAQDVTIFDANASRKSAAEGLGLTFVAVNQDNVTPYDREFDVLFHTSASASGLRSAIDMAAFEGRIIELSWYGAKPITLDLGGAFHSRRLSIVASQVGHVSPARRATTTHSDRLHEALEHLYDPALDALLEPDIELDDLPGRLAELFHPNANILCQVVKY